MARTGLPAETRSLARSAGLALLINEAPSC